VLEAVLISALFTATPLLSNPQIQILHTAAHPIYVVGSDSPQTGVEGIVIYDAQVLSSFGEDWARALEGRRVTSRYHDGQ